MNFISNLTGLASVAASGASAFQNLDHHKKSQQIEQSFHEQELELLRQQHREELKTTKQTYLISTFTDIEQYCQELNENLIDSTRDAERDMVDQRNQQYQTVMLAGTIMLAALITVLIEGYLPTQSGEFIELAYGLSNAGSVVFIALNMLLCIQITFRITRFMYKRSGANLDYLSEALSETKRMMRKIRGDPAHPHHIINDPSHGRSHGSSPGIGLGVRPGTYHQQEQQQWADYNRVPLRSDPAEDFILEAEVEEVATGAPTYPAEGGNTTPVPPVSSELGSTQPAGTVFLHQGYLEKREQQQHVAPDLAAGSSSGLIDTLPIGDTSSNTLKLKPFQRPPKVSELNESEVERQWASHEAEIHYYLKNRSGINERRELNRLGFVSFERFWDEYCKDPGNMAIWCFYLGTALMLVATMVYLWAKFTYIHNSPRAAIVSVTTIGLSLVICLGLAIYLRFFDVKIKQLRVEIKAEMDREESLMDAQQQRRDDRATSAAGAAGNLNLNRGGSGRGELMPPMVGTGVFHSQYSRRDSKRFKRS